MDASRDWLNDPALAEVDKTKLAFLEKLFEKGSSINTNNQKEMLSFLMSLSKLSKENNISFTKNDIDLIFAVLKKHSSPDDVSKMQQISSYFHYK